ncbi:MAG TPA: sialidase family protein [Candidatus Thermoplasmatota archaeon]|jgi:hypothetical protein|nr:sialidase family protein [Candidatus Thermoplasmatota archaeon]
MRLLAPLATLALAGCLSATPTPGDLAPASMSNAWTLDCTLGAFEQARDATWPQACEARASHTEGWKQELWLGVNPTDPGNVVIGAKEVGTAASADCVWNAVQVTHDYGATWTDQNIGGLYADRQPTDPWFGYACNTDPMLAFSANGDVHYGVEVYNLGFMTYDTPLRAVAGSAGLLGWKILLATSHDGGDTWPDVITYQPDLVTVTDYSRMVVSPASGSILEAINHLGVGSCHVLASRDGGQSFDPWAIAEPLPPEQGGSCRVIAAAPDGTVVVGFARGSDTYWVRSTDDGRTFLEGNVGFSYTPIGPFEENEFRTGTNFEATYDADGTLWVIYGDQASGNADLFVRSSPDHGRTWTEPAKVNDDAGEADQFLPNLVVADDGTLHAFFLDKRWDPANKLLDAVHAMSADGLTWTNERVTTRSFDGDLGQHQSGAPFIGDYVGIGASQGHVWAAIPDSSQGNQTVVAAAHVVRG